MAFGRLLAVVVAAASLAAARVVSEEGRASRSLLVQRVGGSSPADAKEHDASTAGGVLGACDLPGVGIRFRSPEVTWSLAEARAGIRIEYEIGVAEDVKAVVPVAQDAGQCDRPGPSGLIVFEELKGGGERYCLCDRGLCPEPTGTAITLRKGVYPRVFAWDGRNWTEPSDHPTARGRPFPPGSYVLTVSAVGRWQAPEGERNFRVAASFDVRLTP